MGLDGKKDDIHLDGSSVGAVIPILKLIDRYRPNRGARLT
jgi:hypothetical protein